jgi:hypothetical protein
MIGANQRQFVGLHGKCVAPRMQRAVVELAEAHDYALDARAEPWQFAVEIESLLALGATLEDLTWLVQGGYAEHAREVTRCGDSSRRFSQPRGLKFTRKTCFLMTPAGLRLTCVTPLCVFQRRAA